MVNLSIDILCEVFGFLPCESLKIAALVCKDWNEIISLSSSTMKKLSLCLRKPFMYSCPCHIDEKRTGKINSMIEAEILSLRRKHKSLKANLMQISPREQPVYLRLLHSFGANTTSLSISASEIDFSELFASMPNLEEISLFECGIPNTIKMYHLCSIELKKLKKLKMFGCDENILKCFKGPNITSVCFRYVDLNSDISKRFFCDLTKLEKLQLCDYRKETFFQESVQDFPFRLKKLVLQLYSGEDETLNKTLNEFFQLQSSSITTIICAAIPRSICKTILNEMKSLRKLKISLETMPLECEFYENLKSNQVLELFELYDYDNDYDNDNAKNYERLIDLIIKKCPNLKYLKTTLYSLSDFVNYGRNYKCKKFNDYFVKK
jgi:F-box-like